ncbi:hypothetical protein GA0070613_4304 [Micromonospora inositola]|uniref:Uncharacterized protein n=1 Tax=Micromonospora inositola TaxID=47865 RepID=A0A1C5JA61_9ACTN|nr:hypothetical protein GA0070613_4304 [Micromonospora inositola]
MTGATEKGVADLRRLRPDTALRDGRGSASIGSMIERKGVRALAR